MEIIVLKKRNFIDQNKKVMIAYNRMQALIKAMNKKEIPTEISSLINKDINRINSLSDSDKELKKIINKSYQKTIKLLEQKLKLVCQNHYRTLWLALGMSVFGVSMGVAFSVALDNFAFIGIGIPIGMVIGMGIGSEMDRKASKEGRQLDLESE